MGDLTWSSTDMNPSTNTKVTTEDITNLPCEATGSAISFETHCASASRKSEQNYWRAWDREDCSWITSSSSLQTGSALHTLQTYFCLKTPTNGRWRNR